MEPEISTRCAQCGAAVRPQTLFCPECGRPAGSKDHEHQPADGDAPDDAESSESALNEELADEGDSEEISSAEAAGEEPVGTVDPLIDRLAALKATAEGDPPAPVVLVMGKESSKPSKRSKSGGKGKQVYNRFPTLRVPAVVPKVALEPGIRFLVVAGALFLFALIAFFLSQYVR
jgi:hypothetical protein